MTEGEIVQHASNAMLLVLMLSMPPIVVAALVGLIVSLIQALTQIQEQTISFAFKLIAIVVTMFLTMGQLGEELFAYGEISFRKISEVVF